MKGWGAQDDFQKEIDAINNSAIADARAKLEGVGANECEDCGEEISRKRREAIPSATRCIRCQTKWELKYGT